MRLLVACLLLLLWSLLGCSAETSATRPTPTYALPPVAPRPAFEANLPDDKKATRVHESSMEEASFSSDVMTAGGRSTGSTVMRKVAQVMPGSGGFSTAVAVPHATPVALPTTDPTKTEDKIEREAQVAIEVKDVSEAAARVIALVQAHQGSITKDQRSSGQQSNAEIVARVPSAHFDAFVSELSSVGAIRNRSIKALDVSIEYKDLGILVANLEAALARYRDLLQKATEPMQVLAIERELERVRSDLDRVKGRLAFVSDRVARSTVAIALHSPEPLPDVPTGDKPYIAPGLRGLTFVDVRESGTNGYVGTGLTLRLPHAAGDHGRGIILDVDVMRACCKSRPDRSEWAYNVLAGLDLYSEALKSGRRRWLNPYLGFRLGLSQTQNRPDFAAAGVFGLEIFKTSSLMIDLQARAIALVGNPDGPHAAVLPSVGFDLGF